MKSETRTMLVACGGVFVATSVFFLAIVPRTIPNAFWLPNQFAGDNSAPRLDEVPGSSPTDNKLSLTIGGLVPFKVDTKGARNNQRYAKDYVFRTQWFSEHIPVWEHCLEEYRGKPNIHYLEIGLFEGRSAFWMLENILTHPSARFTGLDLFSDEYSFAENVKGFKQVFFDNLKKSGCEQKSTIIEGFSQIELRKLPLDSFDIIYIDGSHDESDCLEDAILCWRLLKEGGMLIFDDYLLNDGRVVGEKPKRAIDTFFAFYGRNFELIHVDWQVFMKKKRTREEKS